MISESRLAWEFIQSQWPEGEAPKPAVKELALVEARRRGLDPSAMGFGVLEELCAWGHSDVGLAKSFCERFRWQAPARIRNGPSEIRAKYLVCYFQEVQWMAWDMFSSAPPPESDLLDLLAQPTRPSRDWPEVFPWGQKAKEFARLFGNPKEPIWRLPSTSSSELARMAREELVASGGNLPEREAEILAHMGQSLDGMAEAIRSARAGRYCDGWLDVWRSFDEAAKLGAFEALPTVPASALTRRL